MQKVTSRFDIGLSEFHRLQSFQRTYLKSLPECPEGYYLRFYGQRNEYNASLLVKLLRILGVSSRNGKYRTLRISEVA
jgi:hypothetical protein